MRTPRSLLLQPHVAFHKMWQAHDGQRLLEDPVTKRDYLDQLFRFKPRASKAGVRFFAFCLMDNHVHECGAIADDFKPFSDWMRVAHGTFGQRFNKRNGRRGKVAIERPKTVVLEDDTAILQVMLYLDANPVVAGLVDDAADWEWSSHRFFAYGESNAWTKQLDIPQAYLSLGDSDEERQTEYRGLYEAYVSSRIDTPKATDGVEPSPTSSAEVSGTSSFKPERTRGIACQITWLPGDACEGDYFGRPDWVNERHSRLQKRKRGRPVRRTAGASAMASSAVAA